MAPILAGGLPYPIWSIICSGLMSGVSWRGWWTPRMLAWRMSLASMRSEEEGSKPAETRRKTDASTTYRPAADAGHVGQLRRRRDGGANHWDGTGNADDRRDRYVLD